MKQMIPYFHNSREYKHMKSDFQKLSNQVLRSGIFLQGKFTKLLEYKLAKKLNVKYCVTCNSCTDATYFALSFFKGKKKNIITTNLSFPASATPILRNNKKPIFYGFDKDFLINENVLNYKKNNIHSVILVGLFGKLLNENFIIKLKKKLKVPIIEDLAQNFGATRKNKKFLVGDAGSVSFDPTKILSAPGSGGCVITDNKHLAEHVISLRYHGKEKLDFKNLGFNSQMSELTACYLLSKLRYIDKWNTRRIKISKYYKEILKNKDVISQNTENNIFHKFAINTKNYKELQKNLNQNKIQFKHHYPKFLNEYSLFKKYKLVLKNKKIIADQFISIPNHNFLTDNEVELIANQLKKL